MKLVQKIILVAMIAGCATSPTGRKQLMLIDEGQMASLGNQSFEQMKQKIPIEKSPKVNQYVECVVNHLLRAKGEDPSQWEVKVFKDDSANAFALPGNNIGVHTGILKLATDQSELAAVIGHEIAHVEVGHGNERVSQTLLVQGGLTVTQLVLQGKNNPNAGLIMAGLGLGAQVGVLLPFSRKHETEADILGQQYMAKAGFDPQGAVSLWQKMAKASKGSPPEFLSTHPNPSSRIDELQSNMKKMNKIYQKVENKPQCKS